MGYESFQSNECFTPLGTLGKSATHPRIAKVVGSLRVRDPTHLSVLIATLVAGWASSFQNNVPRF